MQGNGKGEETRNMLGYAKGTDARKYKGQGKAKTKAKAFNQRERKDSLTHTQPRKRTKKGPHTKQGKSPITNHNASASADLTYKPHKKEKKKKSLVEPNKSWKIGLSLSRS